MSRPMRLPFEEQETETPNAGEAYVINPVAYVPMLTPAQALAAIGQLVAILEADRAFRGGFDERRGPSEGQHPVDLREAEGVAVRAVSRIRRVRHSQLPRQAAGRTRRSRAVLGQQDRTGRRSHVHRGLYGS